MSSLNGVHSQDALGVLPEGSVSPRMIHSLEKVHITSNNLGYKGPLSSIRGISEGPAQLQSISRDPFRPLLGLNSAELSPMSGHTLLCSRALPTQISISVCFRVHHSPRTQANTTLLAVPGRTSLLFRPRVLLEPAAAHRPWKSSQS